MQFQLLTLAAASVGAVAGFFLSVGFWAIQVWAEPLEPMMYLGIALLAVYAFLVWGWVAITRKDAEQGVTGGETLRAKSLKRLTALMAQVLLGIVALTVSSLWALDVVRVQTVHLFADRGPMLYTKALVDPSASVSEVACNYLFSVSALRFERELKSELVRRPGVAAKCLAKARENGDSGVDMISHALMSTWQKEVLDAGTREAPFACERAAQFSVVAELAEVGMAEPALFECSLSATDGQVRQCCAQQLGKRGDFLKGLGLSENFTPEEAVELYPMMVKQAFRPLDMTPEDQTVGKSLQFNNETRRLWTLKFGCSLMASGNVRGALRGLVPIIEGGTCNLSETGRVEFASTEPWGYICGEVESLTDTQPVEPALCALMNQSLVMTAMGQARARVMAATRAMYLLASANSVDDGGKGAAMAARQTNPFSPERVFVRDFALRHDEMRRKTLSQRCYRVEMDTTARMERIANGDPDLFKVVSTTDCDSKWEEGYSVADLRRDRFSAVKAAAKDGGASAGDTKKLEATRGRNAVKAAREKIRATREKQGR